MRLSVWLGLGGQSCFAYISSLVFQPRIGIPTGDTFWKPFLPLCGLPPMGPRLFSLGNFKLERQVTKVGS